MEVTHSVDILLNYVRSHYTLYMRLRPSVSVTSSVSTDSALQYCIASIKSVPICRHSTAASFMEMSFENTRQ